MQKSIIERVFPKPKQPILPRYDERVSQYRDDDSVSQSNAPGRIRLNSNASTTLNSERRSSGSRSPLEDRSHASLQPAPLSASVIHHDDPFIAVDRAAATLQKTLQSLLDFQSSALTDRTSNGEDDNASQSSITPTQSATTGSMRGSQRGNSGVVPVRQPRKKKLTLKAARQGIGRSMQEFISLKNEELRIAQVERTNRQVSLDKISDFETKREAVDYEIGLLRSTADSDQYRSLRDEAENVEKQINDLEDQLMELKARHRHLLDKKAEQENASAGQLSSYQGTLAAIDRDIREFLRRPPVKQGLGPRLLSAEAHTASKQDLYVLNPKRRTLQLARQQWAHELDLLNNHEADIKKETQALTEGAHTWKQVVIRIDEFETLLRQSLKSNGSETVQGILPLLDETLIFLQQTLNHAELQDWRLLVCAIGAELEAFKEARALLAPDEPLADIPEPQPSEDAAKLIDSEDDDIPHTDLLDAQPPEIQSGSSSTLGKTSDRIKGKEIERRTTSSVSSNESLKATLNTFPAANSSANGISDSRQFRPSPTRSSLVRSTKITNIHSESEDDDPGPDFLVSHET